jgi:hypothetical protein
MQRNMEFGYQLSIKVLLALAYNVQDLSTDRIENAILLLKY